MSGVSAEAFSKTGDQFLGIPYSEMDCQAFVERVMREVGINYNLPGSNAWYRKMTWVGSPEDCKKKFGVIPKGALLYILEWNGKEPGQYKSDGIGNASHIGIYTARGDGAIHSSKSKGCVCTSKFSGKSINGGWNRIGLWSRFDYGEKVNSILSGKPATQPEKKGGDEKVSYNAIVTAESGDTVNLRQSADKNSTIVLKVPIGATVEVIGTTDSWSNINYLGWSGWMMSKYLKEAVDPNIVTLQLTVEEAQKALLVMDKLVAQLVDKVGRG